MLRMGGGENHLTFKPSKLFTSQWIFRRSLYGYLDLPQLPKYIFAYNLVKAGAIDERLSQLLDLS